MRCRFKAAHAFYGTVWKRSHCGGRDVLRGFSTAALFYCGGRTSCRTSQNFAAIGALLYEPAFYHPSLKSLFPFKMQQLVLFYKMFILSFNVNEQLKIVVYNSCEVNREHARICIRVLWTWLDQTQWSLNNNKFCLFLWSLTAILKLFWASCVH